MLIDKIRINISGGSGGAGSIKFAANKKPSGGNGGTGGNVIFEGSTNVYDYSFLQELKELRAGDGAHGGQERGWGKNGDDLIIKVPLTTVVRDLQGNVLAEVKTAGEQKVICKGGRGGWGNFHFITGGRRTLHKTTQGREGETLVGFLELELMSDIVFVGLPNAGKSSMLNELSGAKVKVAAYPFTTLNPNLGVAQGSVLMDLPGLIEGTVKGKGLGTRFTKHIKHAKLIAHFVGLDSEHPAADYQLIRKELAEIDPLLAEMPEVVVLSKSDLVEPDFIKKVRAELEKLNKQIIVVSIKDHNSIRALLSYLKSFL
jgi:GTP-binding protein